MVALIFNKFRGIGVLEYGSNDERAEVLISILQCSITQSPRLSIIIATFERPFFGYYSVPLWFFRWQGTGGVKFGREPFRIGGNGLVNGFGNGFEHAVEYPLMERIQYIPVQNTKQTFG